MYTHERTPLPLLYKGPEIYRFYNSAYSDGTLIPSILCNFAIDLQGFLLLHIWLNDYMYIKILENVIIYFTHFSKNLALQTDSVKMREFYKYELWMKRCYMG